MDVLLVLDLAISFVVVDVCLPRVDAGSVRGEIHFELLLVLAIS